MFQELTPLNKNIFHKSFSCKLVSISGFYLDSLRESQDQSLQRAFCMTQYTDFLKKIFTSHSQKALELYS